MKKLFPFLLILVLAIILFFVKRNQQQDEPVKTKKVSSEKKSPKKNEPGTFEKARGLDRTEARIILTGHAKCRMSCRHITLKEIKEILKDGKINYNKSEIDDTPEYVLEGYSHESQHIRIVVAPVDKGLKLITCIDLDEDWKCNCE